nr:PI-PLC X domain-containing protein 1-like [Aotus nancymaae]
MKDSAPPPPSPQGRLSEISEWLERHPREVVILVCRNFEGLSEDLHEYLISCIKTIFGEMLCPRRADLELGVAPSENCFL